ncbi:MAG: Radical domain protein [Bacteroidetes bacterium]|nr:Radical domain protein [Bacteroidota bacterium]
MYFTKQYAFCFFKIINLSRLSLSFLLYGMTDRLRICFLPAAVSIEPINRCNLCCPECPAGNQSLLREKELMKWDVFVKVIDELSPSLFWTTLYFQGEPFLHPQFQAMINYCHHKKIFTYTSSNGQLLTSEIAKRTVESGLDKIVISVDGLTQEVYQQYRRGGNLRKVVETIQHIAYWKKRLKSRTPVVEAQFIVMKHNEFQLHDVKKTLLSWGADRVSLKTAQIEFERIEQLVPSQKKYSRYEKTANGSWQLKKRLKNRCWRQWSGAVIAANGDVLPCCFDKNGEYVFGNVEHESFFEIWNGGKANLFRSKIHTNRKEIAICRNCTE